jgi:hypothetical protein
MHCCFRRADDVVLVVDVWLRHGDQHSRRHGELCAVWL